MGYNMFGKMTYQKNESIVIYYDPLRDTHYIGKKFQLSYMFQHSIRLIYSYKDLKLSVIC